MRTRRPEKSVADAARRVRIARIDTKEFTPWPVGGLLVGGAVRDALLGRTPDDLDWLAADPRAAAQALAVRVDAPVFPLDEDRGHWRVLIDDGAGRVVHDFVPYRGHAAVEVGGDNENDDAGATAVSRDGSDGSTNDDELLVDLERRDLTINAIALRESGELVDPTGGVDDLRAGIVRMTSLASLQADPIRPLRAVRFAGHLDFVLADETRTAVAQEALAQLRGEARRPAAERVRDELSAILAAATAAPTLALAAELGLLETFLPELDATRGIRQGPLHHLDVFAHSLEALQRLSLAFPDSSLSLRLATLLHDIGKPATVGSHWTGRPTFYSHDSVGAELTARALRRLRFSGAVVATVSSLVRRHMTPLPRSEKSARRFVHRHRAILPDLLRLMIADREAARGRRASEAGRRAYRIDMARVIAIMKEAPPPARLLGGDDVMALLGLRPGPKVGEALALLDEAAAVGDVKDRESARAYLQRYARAQGWEYERPIESGTFN